MNQFLAFFPLNLVVFPNEVLKLHIFEERYKQLINECFEHNLPFGIPSIVDKKQTSYGAELHPVEIVTRFPDGKMDIITRCSNCFRVLDFYEPKEKLYATGMVQPLRYSFDEDKELRLRLTDLLKELYRTLYRSENLPVNESTYNSFDIGHKAGLSQVQELELMKLEVEADRMWFLIEHLKSFIPQVQKVERMKELVKLNGHFRKLSLEE